MRATPAQGAVYQICGKFMPMICVDGDSLTSRIKEGRRMLVSLTGKDFGYDLQAWHNYLKESRDGGYTWARTIALPKIMKEAIESEEWQNAVHNLESR